MSSIILYFNSALILSAPILLVAIGVCFSEKAGVYAMNSDSSMLGACFVSVLVMLGTGNAALSILGGIIAGGLIAALFSIFSVRIGANQCLIGLAFNFMVIGLTSSLLRLFWSTGGIPQFDKLLDVPIPGLSKIPFIGEILFDQPIMMYLLYIIIPISWWVLFKSTWGLKLRAVGENPSCADTVGIKVLKTRTIAVIVGGLFSGCGGAVLAIQQVGTFTEEMTGARAWMGIISAYFGGWSPIGATGAALVFGLAEALEKRIQLMTFINLSSYVVQMFPYIAAVIVIVMTGRNRRHPAAMARYYQKQ
ncbi:MAG: ABC transporter permease [Oscillospiraceae bacterium]|nr:ABC transporter permease [Oscillospiraceae bacterium]